MSRSNRTRRVPAALLGAALSDEDRELFLRAVADTRPIKPARLQHQLAAKQPPPVPVQSLLDNHATIVESLSGPITHELRMEMGEELLYIGKDVARTTIGKLRRGHWVVQRSLDLHGYTREEAHAAIAEFLRDCIRSGARCIRIIHGKGLRSPGREPVLKNQLRSWLINRQEVLAFCQAPTHLGGAGAALVLLKRLPDRSR